LQRLIQQTLSDLNSKP